MSTMETTRTDPAKHALLHEGIHRFLRAMQVGNMQWIGFGRLPGCTVEDFEICVNMLRGLERTGRLRISRIHREGASGKAMIDMVAIEKLRD
jgi:hypothetical protein